MRKYKTSIISFSVIVLSLVFLFFFKSPSLPQEEQIPEESASSVITEEPIAPQEEYIPVEIPVESIKKDTPAQKSADVSESAETLCSLSVKCDSVFKNIENLKSNKIEYIPENGVFFSDESVLFHEGETVFNVLSRELKRNGIHFEFSKTPAYNSMYIEGIGNLYEFDCGELSGWIYKVNGKTPGVGCSQYKVSNGDMIEFIYHCGN